MVLADIKLGYTCNNNCIRCVIADQREDALKRRGNIDRTTEEYKKEILDSRQRGITAVVFTGGEPTIRKDLMELLVFAKSIGLNISMQTNGRMFYYREFAEKLAPFNINYTIAVHDSSEEIHDKITRAKGSFNQTIQGIKNLAGLGQTITGKVVISKLNYTHLPAIADMFIRLGAERICCAFPHAQGNARKYFDQVVPRYTNIKKYVYETIEMCNKAGTHVEFEAIPFCFMEGRERHVSDLKFVEKGPYIELKQLDGQTHNWQQLRKKIKQKFPQCKLCKYDNMCEGPWKEYPAKFGDGEFKPVRGCSDDCQDT